jgi:hypothetical protein
MASLLQHPTNKKHHYGDMLSQFQPKHRHVIQGISENLHISASSGSVAFGNRNVRFIIPREGYLSEVYLKLNYAQGSSDVLANQSWYLQCIDFVEIRVGSTQVVHINDYYKFVPYIIGTMEAQRRHIFLNQASTTSSDYPNLLIPIWTPWSRLCNNDNSLPPLPAFSCEGNIEITVSFRPSSAVITGGTSGTLSGELIIDRSLTSSFDRNQSWSCKSYTIQEGPDRPSWTTSAVRTSESHINGDLVALYIYLTSDSNVSNADTLTTTLPTALSIFHNGTRIQYFTGKNEVLAQMSTRGQYEKIAQGGGADDACVVYFSPVSSASLGGTGYSVDRSTLEVELTADAASTGRVFGILHASYTISNGVMHKTM